MLSLPAGWNRWLPLLYFVAGVAWTLLTAAIVGPVFGDERRHLLLGGIVSGAAFAAFLAWALALRSKAWKKESELARSAAEARNLLQTMIDASTTPIYAFDRDGRALLMNTACATVLGQPVESLIGKTRTAMHSPEFAAAHEAVDRQVFDSGQVVSVEEHAQGVDGERVFLSTRFPLRNVDGAIIAVGGVSTEITELRHAQDEAARANANLEQTVSERTLELIAARDRAEQADRAKTAFLSTVSHELRTPLNSIIGFTDIVVQGLAGPINEEQRHQLSIVQDSAHMLLELINEILDISRIEAGRLQLSPQEFDLAELLRRRVDAMASSAARKGLALEMRVTPDVMRVTSDPTRVAQIVSNLLSNAVKFTDAGKVTLEGRVQGDRAVVVVQDTGPGIEAADLALLFRPFAQVGDNARQHREGTGLGLVISQYLARAMGGDITVRSTPGEGSRFELVLPLELPGATDLGNSGIYRRLMQTG